MKTLRESYPNHIPGSMPRKLDSTRFRKRGPIRKAVKNQFSKRKAKWAETLEKRTYFCDFRSRAARGPYIITAGKIFSRGLVGYSSGA